RKDAQAMSPHLSTRRVTGPLPDKLDLQLLHDAQAYLQCRVQREIPSLAASQAWQSFYQTYDPMLRHFVRSCHVPRGEARDCLQDVWTEVFRKLTAFASDGSQGRLCSWLYAIAHSKAINSLRDQ